jgi:pyruvate dehydrogenase E2 component (dihydrolipoamide acetyltransferase)
MPKLGLTMEEAMIIEWLVDDGSEVSADQPIILIETDKTETEVGAPDGGRLHQLGRPGDVFACGEVIGYLLAEGEHAPTRPASEPAAVSTFAPPSVGTAPTTDTTSSPAPFPATAGGRVLASPNARRVAAELGVPLHTVRGTGPGGRIVSEDVEDAVAAGIPSPDATGAGAGRSVVATVAARNLADLLGIDLATVPVDPVERRVTRDGVA